MAEQKNGESVKPNVKTLGVRLPDELHAQFSLVTTLDGLSLADGVLHAVKLYVDTKRAEADFASRASVALAEIEREAQTRKAAIEALFGQGNSHEEPGEQNGAAAKPATTRKGRA